MLKNLGEHVEWYYFYLNIKGKVTPKTLKGPQEII